MSAVVPDQAPNSVCSQCGAEFRCGMDGGDAECWCASLPPLLPIPAAIGADVPAAGCLCPTCLTAKLAVISGSRSA